GLLADQVEAAGDRFPSAELAVVIGSDKLLQLLDPSWYDDRDRVLDAMFHRASVSFVMRVGDETAVGEALALPGNDRWAGRIIRLPVSGEVAAVSSSEIRDLVRRGKDVTA